MNLLDVIKRFSSKSHNISSCQSSDVENSGLYIIDLISNENEITQNIKVFCEVEKDDGGLVTGKYIDVIKTLAVADDENKLDEVASYFFRANNT